MIRDKHNKNLYLIPAAQTRDKSAVSPSDMVRLCDELRRNHDWIIIDSPAGIERGFRNAIAPSDHVFIVTNPEVSAVRDADRIIGLVEAEGKGPVQLIINRINPLMVKKGDMLSTDDIVELLAIDLIGIIPEDSSVLVSTNRGIPVSLDSKSQAGAALRNIARRMMGEHVDFMDLYKSKNILNRLGSIIRSGGGN
jgi:septum site-determining protein MinD